MTTIVKLGGSLAADPDRLRSLLAEIAEGAYGACVVVPGGGAFADAVRAAQAAEGFCDAEAHRRALDAMGRMADFFVSIEPRLTKAVAPWTQALPSHSAGEGGPRVSGGRERGAPFPKKSRQVPYPGASRRPSPPLLRRVPSPAEGGGRGTATVWDPALLRAGHPDIPESWDVTSDSLALWLAARLAARRCVLVKSADAARGLDPAALARAGLVDAAFPAFAARFPGAIEIRGPSGTVALPRRAAA